MVSTKVISTSSEMYIRSPSIPAEVISRLSGAAWDYVSVQSIFLITFDLGILIIWDDSQKWFYSPCLNNIASQKCKYLYLLVVSAAHVNV